MSTEFTDPLAAMSFITGGRAVFTIQSEKTGKHYTYRIASKKGETSPLFVKVLRDGVNTSWANQLYAGILRTASVNGHDILQVLPGKNGFTGPSTKALNWALVQLQLRTDMHDDLRVMHEGKCCKCGRTLTHPDSLETGIGPECSKKD